MKIKCFFPPLLSFFIPFFALAQIGITGTVIDGDFNEPLPFANILLKETGEGVTSDFDGKYSFELEEGTYTLQFSFVGYETKIVTQIQVMGNEYTITDVVLNSAAQGLEEVIVTVEASRNSEASVLEIQRKSASLFFNIEKMTNWESSEFCCGKVWRRTSAEANLQIQLKKQHRNRNRSALSSAELSAKCRRVSYSSFKRIK